MHDALLTWWVAEGRHDLPWRATRDPWAVLVSELMLQQTQVPRVATRWPAFLARFPSPAACAAAPLADVVRAWEGLGYNRRAVNLHRAAATIVADHGGRLPGHLDALLSLPGVGPYTARAVLVFAFGHDIGLVDTNAGRFLARAVAGRALTPREAQDAADGAVPEGDGWRWGQAVFDLGAAVCTRRSPDCARCPLRGAGCRWAAAGWPEPDPIERSAGIARPQSRFAGSDRQGRGRLVDALRRGAVDPEALPTAAGWPADRGRAERIAAALVTDGLAVVDAEGRLRLA